MIKDPPEDESASAGFSLVAVLVFMLIVSAVVVPFAVMARTRLMIAKNEVEQERLSLLAEGLTNVIASELAGSSATGKLPLDSTPTRCRAGKFTFDVRVQDHGGLIDLNAADARLLSQGFVSLGIDPQISEALAEAAIRYRASANAFAAQAEPQASTVGPADNKAAPFESVSELQEFAALASTPLPDLYGILTVNSKRGTVALDHAPNRLRALLTDASESRASVMQTVASAPAYTVDITAMRDGSGIAGHACFIIEPFPTSPAGFRRISQIPIAETVASPPSPITASCDTLFGAEATEILRGQSS